MDPIQARRLAQQLIPDGQRVAHERADSIGLNATQIRSIDGQPGDRVLTQDELYQAIVDNKVEVDAASGRISRVTPQVSFVDTPAGPGPARDLFPGYASLGSRNPQTQPLQGDRPGVDRPPAMSLGELTQRVQTPDQVTRLLQPFGSEIYDRERAAEGTGPSGAQSPEFTFANRSGICRDSHQLGAYVLQQNGYDARQIGYKAEGVLHAVLSYAGKNGEGFGLIEYGTHYSPEQIAQVLGRPALSHEEALMAVRPEAKMLNLYSTPEAQAEGHISSLYYTMGNMLYQDTLRLKHENSAEWSANGGVNVEAALGEHWGMKFSADTGGSPDPTARNAISGAVGYQTGDADNWTRLSAGLQYRPEEGHHSVGPNQWEQHPALVAGLHGAGQWTPFQARLGENHSTRTTLGFDGTAALAFSRGEGTDAANGTRGGGWELNNGLSMGLSRATTRVGQHFDGRLSDQFSYRSEVFIQPDLLAMSMGYGTGGTGLYSNTGANASLHYNNGGLGAYVGGQYLLTQVNNLEATGAATGVSYSSGPISLRADASMQLSPEGTRLRTSQEVNLKLLQNLDAYGYASQEQIFNDTHGRFSNPGGQNVGIGLRARF